MKKNSTVSLMIFLLLTVSACNLGGEASHSHAETKDSHEKVVYTCSMHPEIRESEPGNCPICHMKLTKLVMAEEDDRSGKHLEEKQEEQKAEDDHSEHEHANAKSYYTCSMHPEIREDKPGKCPICHMNLTKVTVSEEDHVPEKNHSREKTVAIINLRKVQYKHFNPSYFKVQKQKMSRKIRILGSVLQSEEKESNIPARVAGRVEKVFVKSTGSMINKSDPVIEIYSPKLITAGEEYLLARKNAESTESSDFKDILIQSEGRLRQWGIRKFQYESWYKRNKVPQQIRIYSEASGIVRKRNASVGKYFKEGQNFFELSDLADVWVEMDVYEFDSALVEIGQKVDLEFTALPGEKYSGEIDFVSPVLDLNSRTLKVRTTIKNASGKLKPGMIADAVLNIEKDEESLVVPRSAVIDTGKRKVVWVKGEGNSFSARKIETAYESEGFVELKSGLKAGDLVVVEGSFLLDSQAQLMGAYSEKEKMKHNH